MKQQQSNDLTIILYTLKIEKYFCYYFHFADYDYDYNLKSLHLDIDRYRHNICKVTRKKKYLLNSLCV